MRLEIYDSKDLNFVELNITGGNDTLIRCDKESKFIDSVVFNVFTPCFENANKLYEYYGPTKYNARKIIPLRNELITFRDKLKALASVKEFDAMVSEHFLGREFLEELQKNLPDYTKNWSAYRDSLVKLNIELITITEKCADEERILWVVGY
ncbi:MAG: hypothetical protein IPM71_01810 [Bacteroidota bacterium]|nr:MAG: hypothetical protein IPM71_01810 [Bacteroidota bacterium]